MLPVLFVTNPNCAPSAAFFGMMGVTIGLILPLLGSAYGIAKSGVGAVCYGVMSSRGVMKGLLPTILAEVFAIYGFVISMINASQIIYTKQKGYSSYRGFAHLSSGLCVGLACVAAGMCVGVVGDAGVRAFAKRSGLYVSLILIIIFAEALGLYGLITGLMMGMLNSGPECEPACPDNECGYIE